MAAVALLGSTWNTTSGSKSVTATPAVGDLIVIGIGHSGNATSTAPTDNQSGTYTKLNSTTKGGGADLVEIWVRDQLVSSAVSHTFTHNPGTTTGGGLIVFNASGCAAGGTGGIQQSGTKAQTAAGNTPTVPFGAAVSSANPVVAFLVNQSSPAGVTEPTGFTEVLDTGYSTPTTGIEAVKINSGASGSAVTWTSTSATIYCALAAELLAAGGTTFNDTLGEAVTVNGAPSATATFGPTLSEGVTAADTQASIGTFGVPIAEAVTPAASLASAATFPSAISEAVTPAFTVTGGLLFGLSLAESVTAAAAQNAIVTFGPALSEAVTPAAALTNGATFANGLSASIVAADTSTAAAILGASVSESVTANDSDGAVAQYANLLSETLGLNVGLAVAAAAAIYNETLTESVALSSSFLGRTLFERGAVPGALEIASLAQPPAISITAQAAIGAVGISAGSAAGALSITDEPQPADLVWN